MLILNLNTAEHTEHTPIPITHNDLVYLKKIGNYQQTFHVITKLKLMPKTKTETTLALGSLDFIY